MHNNLTNPDNSIAQLPLTDLRQKWAECWGIPPHARIGRSLLERSLEFKLREQAGQGLTEPQRIRLEKMVRAYTRSPASFDEKDIGIKPGTKLVRTLRDERHIVTVLDTGFEYKGVVYSSLSAISSKITGFRRNGWIFFGLKKEPAKK